MQPKIPYACQKHDSPMDRRLSMNNRAIPFEPGMKGVSQENPTSFLWKNYTWRGYICCNDNRQLKLFLVLKPNMTEYVL